MLPCGCRLLAINIVTVVCYGNGFSVSVVFQILCKFNYLSFLHRKKKTTSCCCMFIVFANVVFRTSLPFFLPAYFNFVRLLCFVNKISNLSPLKVWIPPLMWLLYSRQLNSVKLTLLWMSIYNTVTPVLSDHSIGALIQYIFTRSS